MTNKKKCAGACGRALADTAENFQPVVGRNAERLVLRTKCRDCTRAEIVAARAEKRAAWLAAARASGKLACTGACGRKRPVEDFMTKSGRVRRHCRSCRNLQHRVYKRGPNWKAWHVAKRPRCREMSRATKRKTLAAGRLSHPVTKTQSWINQNVQRGKLQKPTTCSRCPNGRGGGYRIAGYLPPGKMGLAAVEWYCYPCLWKVRHPKTEDDLDEERERDEQDRDPTVGRSVAALLRNLAIDRSEFLEIHRAHEIALTGEDTRLLIVEAALGVRAAHLERVGHQGAREIPLECVLGHWIPKRTG